MKLKIVCTWASSSCGSSIISFRDAFMGSIKVTVKNKNFCHLKVDFLSFLYLLELLICH